MKNSWLPLATLGAACLLAFSAEAAVVGDAQLQAKLDGSRQVREEISLLNLLRGLYLSQAQLDQLIALAEKAEATRTQFLRQALESAPGYDRDLAALRDALYTPTGVPEELERRVGRQHLRTDIEPKYLAAEELGRIEDQARDVLSEAQVAIIESFKPCLIPPKSLSDPIAVGQATSTAREEAALDLIRRMPEALYQQRAQAIAAAIVGRGEREKGKMPDDVRANTVATYVRKMNDVRRLSPVDFELKKKELAEWFQLFDDSVTYHKGHTRQLGPVSHYLLNSRAAEAMKKWRDARAQDPAESDLKVAAASEPGDKRGKAFGWAVGRYGLATGAWLRERSRGGQIGPKEGAGLLKDLAAVKELPTLEQQFAAINAVADRLYAGGPTRAAVDALLAKVGALAALKRVPLAPPPAHAPGQELGDLTGLAATVQQARQNADAGRLPEAFNALAAVAAHLAQFRD